MSPPNQFVIEWMAVNIVYNHGDIKCKGQQSVQEQEKPDIMDGMTEPDSGSQGRRRVSPAHKM